MKNLFIILSLILLSSHVIGDSHKGETLYRWKTSSGIVWKGFSEKDTNPKYQGDVKNGKPHGLGYLIYSNGNRYVGRWKNGEKNGLGTETDRNGFGYEGEWKNGYMWNGKGYDIDGNIQYKWIDGIRIKQ